MDSIYTQKMLFPASRCDASGFLGLTDAFYMFQDLATDHAKLLGFGADVLTPQGRFWISIATRVKILERPSFSEEVTLETWPHTPSGIRCLRDYRMLRGSEVMVLGRSQWGVFNRNTGRVDRPDTAFPMDLACPYEITIDEPFLRIRDDGFGEPFASYTIRSTDIDLNGHMNNVAYVRAFQSLYSTEEWKRADIRDMEVHYKNQCYEGEVLSFSEKTADGIRIVRAAVGERTALYIALR